MSYSIDNRAFLLVFASYVLAIAVSCVLFPGMIRRVLDFFRNPNSQLEQDPPAPEPENWTTHDSNVTLFKCLSVPGPSRPTLPAEIILLILADPSRWIETQRKVYTLPRIPHPHHLDFRQGNDREPVLSTDKLSAAEALELESIIFTFCSQDQGWSDHREHHGTYNQSYTWWEWGRDMTDGLWDTRSRLQSNRHAGRKPEQYRVTVAKDHDIVQSLIEGERIGLWARAMYPGWVNKVYGASIELVFFGKDPLDGM